MTAVNDAPVLDLDANNSSGATGANFTASFTEDGGPVAIADADAVLARHRQREPDLAHGQDHQPAEWRQ